MKKVGIGLLAGAIMLVVGMFIGQVFQFLFPLLKNEYQNQNLFRPWADSLMSIMFVPPFLVGIILSWIWDITRGVLKGNTAIEKGLRFGFIYWIITIPGMFMSYSSFPISFILVCSWSITIMGQALSAGIFFSKTLK